MKNWNFKRMVIMTAALTSFFACQKEDSAEVEEFVNESVYQLQVEHSIGRSRCFELVFPVSMLFPDGSSVSYNSYAELIAGLRAWKSSNPGINRRPKFVYPLDVIKKDGSIVTVSSKEEMAELRKECPDRKTNGPRGHITRGLACFDLVFPLTLTLPDRSEVAVASSSELKAALKAWKFANPGRNGKRPHLKFPYDVVFKDDGQVMTINSPDDLIALKDQCN